MPSTQEPLCPICRRVALALPAPDSLDHVEGLPRGWSLWPKEGRGDREYACVTCHRLFSAATAYDEAY